MSGLVSLLARIGANEAMHLARVTQRPIAEVFEELTHEEGRGRVRVLTDHRNRRRWEAMVPDNELPPALRGGALEAF